MAFLPKSKILVPIDFSDSSWDALRTALELCNSPAGVRALHVVAPLHVAEPSMIFASSSDSERLKAAEETLDQRMGEMDLPASVQREVVLGNPRREIAERAEAGGAELIVIPSHGRSGFERLVLGSVTENVLRHASCPVLVLRSSEST